MISYYQLRRRGFGSQGSNAGVAAGGAIAAAGGLVSGTVIGLPVGVVMAAVGALVALGSTIAGALHIGEGCGPTCIQATNVVNGAEPTFKMNVDAYEAGTIDQSTAVSNYQQMWNAVQQSCGAIPGTAGKDCVGDRQAGACKWKSNGQCWNWDIGYHQPLLQPATVPYSGGPTSVDGAAGSIVSSLTSNPMLLVGGVLLVVGLMAGKD
jgi:hypothetical protein